MVYWHRGSAASPEDMPPSLETSDLEVGSVIISFDTLIS